MNKKKASATLYFILFFVIFLAFCAFAVDGAIVLASRLKLQNATEMTAVAAASEFNSDVMSPSANLPTATEVNNVDLMARNTFSLLQKDSLKTAKISNLNVDGTTRKVTIETTMVAQPLFLSFIGVDGINISAKAIAQSESLSVYANYTGVNWLTKSARYSSDILSMATNMHDTAILKPLGDFESTSYKPASSEVNFSRINASDNTPLSLGPGGFITIKLPAPIIDKKGYDLYIKEIGEAVEGYMVFAGLDKNPNNPYVQSGKEGDGIAWINISCTGVQENGGYNAHSTALTQLGNQAKFYGSGYFDISDPCAGEIHMAKYIRIIDDNSEQAYVNGSQVMVYGESSSPTPGADIDVVQVLNYVRLID